MRLDDEAESTNVEDRRGRGAAVIGGGGLLVVVAALIAIFVFKVDPSEVLNALNTVQVPAEQGKEGAPGDAQGAFAAKVLRSTEEVWTQKFAGAGRTYTPPKLVLYDNLAGTGCGLGQSAMGPFYCPQDRRMYLDLSFFHDLESRFGAPGEAARAYVIAHEIGHHVQTLLGISDQVQAAQRGAGSREQANKVSVQTELQADCFAGVWARASGRLDANDIDQALAAAAAVGDDRLQRETQGTVVPDSFTHGSSAQRQHWFRVGFKSGDPDACDTFGTGVGFGSTRGGPEDD